jgi:hypothetical protein
MAVKGRLEEFFGKEMTLLVQESSLDDHRYPALYFQGDALEIQKLARDFNDAIGVKGAASPGTVQSGSRPVSNRYTTTPEYVSRSGTFSYNNDTFIILPDRLPENWEELARAAGMGQRSRSQTEHGEESPKGTAKTTDSPTSPGGMLGEGAETAADVGENTAEDLAKKAGRRAGRFGDRLGGFFGPAIAAPLAYAASLLRGASNAEAGGVAATSALDAIPAYGAARQITTGHTAEGLIRAGFITVHIFFAK